MELSKVCFFLHFDGKLNEEGSPQYVGGNKKGIKVARNIQYKDLLSVIHEKLGTDPTNTVLSIKCRFVPDASNVMVYDVNDDNDVEVIMTMFDSKTCIAVSLYVIKHPKAVMPDHSSPSMPSKKSSSSCHKQAIVAIDVNELVDSTMEEGRDAFYSDSEDVDAISDMPNETSLNESRELPQGHVEDVEKEDFLVKTSLDDGDMDNLNQNLDVGSRFKDFDHFKMILKETAIQHNFVYTFTESTSSTYAARCRESNCKWRIRASKYKGMVKIKRYNSEHTCSLSEKSENNPLATSKWIANACKGNIVGDINPAKIISYVKEHWGLTIGYKKAFRAKEILTEHAGRKRTLNESYTLLPAYSLELERSNPGSYMLVARCCDIYQNGDQSFLRAFWTFGACRRSYSSTLRPLLVVDDIDLTGKYQGTLLVASGVDGNGGVLPIAYAVVEVQSCETWAWFLHLLQRHVVTPEHDAISILSKRDDELIEAIHKDFPNAKTSYCIQHLSATLYDKYEDLVVQKLFWRAAKTSRACEHIRLMEAIKNQNEQAYKCIVSIAKEKWANAYFEGNRYDVLTTNKPALVDVFLKDAMTLPISALIEHTRKKTAEYFHIRRKRAITWTKPLTQYGEEHINTARETGRHYIVLPASVYDFQVKSSMYQDHVRLNDRICSCGVFQTLGLPCEHAMAAIEFGQYDPYIYCKKWYLARSYLETYEEVISPTLEQSQWQPCAHPLPEVLPPNTRKRRGRPKSQKIELKISNSLPRMCSKCGELGHNKRGCKNTPDCDSTSTVLEPSMEQNCSDLDAFMHFPCE